MRSPLKPKYGLNGAPQTLLLLVVMYSLALATGKSAPRDDKLRWRVRWRFASGVQKGTSADSFLK